MSVTIRDVNTNEEIIIPPEGLIFGRTGGDADIQLDDNSISRRQARVSLKGGNWLVETIAVAQGQRPPRPVTLVEGQTFIVGNNEFEVVSIAESDEEEEAPPPPKAPVRAPVAKPPARAPTMKTTPATAAAPKRAAPAAKKPPQAADDEDPSAGGADEAGGGKGIGAMFIAAPKGLAYYIVNVPKMLFNPLGTVRTAIEEQPAEPMGRTEIIGYALPALLATGLLVSISTSLAMLIGPGHTFSVMSLVPIIIGFVFAIVTGFVFHPAMEWIIRFLQGESDARSRTNYFLQLMTLFIVLAVPNAIGVLLGLLSIPFLNLVGPLLMTVASLVSMYVVYQWFVSFGVVKWFRTVLLVLGALSVVGAAFGFVMGVVHTIQGFGSHSSAISEVASGDVDEPEKMGGENPEAVKASAKQIAAEKKQAAAAQGEAEAEKSPPAKAEKTVAPKVPEPEPEATVTEEPVAKPPEPKPAKSSGYVEFARKRELIEKLLSNDPTPLAASNDLQDAYGEFLKDTSEIDKKWQKEIAKNSNKSRLYEHLRDAELYKQTGKQVDSLASKLKIR